jgi:HEAT repeat protein
LKYNTHVQRLSKENKEKIMKPQTKSQSKQQISELIIELGDSNFLKRQHARLLLVHHEPESIPALLETLESPNPRTRREAVNALGDIRAPETAPALTEMLLDEDTGVRWAAMESLIRMGRDALRPILEKFIQNFDSLWLREGVHHILRVFKDRHELNDLEINLFEKLDKQSIPGFGSSWTSEQAWAAEKALEALDREEIQLR